MTSYIHILGDSELALWGLRGKQRLERQLGQLAGVALIEAAASIPPDASVIYLRGDYLFDGRLLQALVDTEAPFILTTKTGCPVVAVRAHGDIADKVAAIFSGRLEEAEPSLPIRSVNELAHVPDLRLRKYDALTLLPIGRENRQSLEKELFSGSYKGVTDFVTKWLWPLPARLATKLCVQHQIQANQVTLASLVLAILAGLLFWHGYFGPGLLLGWIMTFLDTVDGKLARVTVTASRLGNVLDHGLDLIHPPLWYWAWAVGLSASGLLAAPLSVLIWLIFLGYIGGRVCEGIFELWLARFSIFIWRELDSFHRLVTARRNPNMVLLTLGYMAGRPDVGLYLVILWHGLCTLFLAWRALLAWREKQRTGALVSWLEGIDPQQDRHRLAVRVFIRRPVQ